MEKNSLALCASCSEELVLKEDEIAWINEGQSQGIIRSITCEVCSTVYAYAEGRINSGEYRKVVTKEMEREWATDLMNMKKGGKQWDGLRFRILTGDIQLLS
mgnify:CR=1 FL=1